MRTKLTIGPEGEVAVPARQAEALGLAGGGDVDVVSPGGALALLVPSDAYGRRAFFAGSLASLTIAEIVQFAFSSLKTGTLMLAFGGDDDRGGARARLRRKSIHFKDGELVFASSSDPAERLGPVLVKAGLVGEEDLERCSGLVSADRELGQVLVDEGMITPGQLHEAIAAQVREIFLSAFTETSGEFAFIEGAPEGADELELPERTRDLVLEGMKRAEEAEQRRALEPASPPEDEMEAPAEDAYPTPAAGPLDVEVAAPLEVEIAAPFDFQADAPADADGSAWMDGQAAPADADGSAWMDGQAAPADADGSAWMDGQAAPADADGSAWMDGQAAPADADAAAWMNADESAPAETSAAAPLDVEVASPLEVEIASPLDFVPSLPEAAALIDADEPLVPEVAPLEVEVDPVADETAQAIFEVPVEIEIEAPLAPPLPEPRTKRGTKQPPSAGPFETYRRIFKRVTEEISRVEPKAAARLNAWFDRLPETRRRVFEGIRLGEDGDMDVAQVLVNVESAGTHQGAASRARALEALEEFLAFALFQAKSRLPRAQAEKLLREVGRMQMGKA